MNSYEVTKTIARLSIAGLTCSALLACNNEKAEPSRGAAVAPDTTATLAELVGPSVFEAGGVRYTLESPPKEDSLSHNINAMEMSFPKEQPMADVSEMRFRPMFAAEAEKTTFLYGLDYHQFRVVGEFPKKPGGLFDDPRFDKFIAARSECAAAVERLFGRIGLYEYEEACLLKRDSIPNRIRSVVGLLVVPSQPVPFCGATIVSSHQVATSKHCFWHENGTERETYRHLALGEVAFVFDVPRRLASTEPGQTPGSLKGSAAVSPESLSGVSSHRGVAIHDHVVLELTDSFQGPSALVLSKAEIPESPFGVWLVGSHPGIEQLDKFSTLLDFVRGSAPNLCAVVHVDDQGCAYHSCQSRQGTSGSGLLLDLGATAALVATHRGASDMDSPCDADGFRDELVPDHASSTPGLVALEGFNVAILNRDEE